MNSTLDRLKALNSKLDAKLNEKRNRELSRDTSDSKKETSLPESKDIAESVETARNLAKSLVESMGIDTESESVRVGNIYKVAELYNELEIYKKVPDFNNIFIYKAMNISGIGLKEDDFGEIREGKYVQVIAITYEPDKNGKKKAKNISLGYFGKAESLSEERKNTVIEFVLRWRYEKAFQNLEHYRLLLEKIEQT